MPVPEVAAPLAIFSEVTAVAAFLIEPTQERAEGLLVGGVLKGFKLGTKGGGETVEALAESADNTAKVIEAAEQFEKK